MKTTVARTEDELASLVPAVERLADRAGADALSQRLSGPLVWLRHFARGGDLGAARGQALLGLRCRVEAPHFVLAWDAGELCGVAPLLAIETLIERGAAPARLLSFIPDSVLFFEQDLLVSPADREATIGALLARIEEEAIASSRAVALGHIPSTSPNIDAIRSEIAARLAAGWEGGEATHHVRGGVAPWNLAALTQALEAALRSSIPTETGASIAAFVADLKRQSRALVVFTDTRRKLEARLEAIVATLPDAEAAVVRASVASPPIVYPMLALPRDEAALLARFTSTRRATYARAARRFERAGGVIEVVRSEALCEDDVRCHLALHAARWGEESVALSPETASFHVDFAMTAAGLGQAVFFFARLDGERIASLECFDVGARRQYFYAGRSAAAAKHRAGKLLVLRSLVDAIERGLATYDFGYGGQAYKLDFTRDSRTAQSFFLARAGRLPDLSLLYPGYERIVIDQNVP